MEITMNETNMDDFCFVESSNLESVGTKGSDLFVEFKNGAIYKYPGLSMEFDNLITADSVGKYFVRNVRNETNIRVTDIDDID
jgi:hypothetical protein